MGCADSFSFYILGQKCSALSRLYVSSSIWNGGFKDQLLVEVAKIRVGVPTDWSNFMGPVMYVLILCSIYSFDILIGWLLFQWPTSIR
jgi:hypothetical protein